MEPGNWINNSDLPRSCTAVTPAALQGAPTKNSAGQEACLSRVTPRGPPPASDSSRNIPPSSRSSSRVAPSRIWRHNVLGHGGASFYSNQPGCRFDSQTGNAGHVDGPPEFRLQVSAWLMIADDDHSTSPSSSDGGRVNKEKTSGVTWRLRRARWVWMTTRRYYSAFEATLEALNRGAELPLAILLLPSDPNWRTLSFNPTRQCRLVQTLLAFLPLYSPTLL